MPLISQEDINKVIEASDLAGIAEEVLPDLKQRGASYSACCPFHNEKTPSFHIDVNKQVWHCFGCGEGGNVVTFVMKKYDMSFVEAIEWLAQRAGIKISRTSNSSDYANKNTRGKLVQICTDTAQFYHRQLMKVRSAGSNQARSYLGQRGFGSEVSKRWSLGFAPGGDQLTRFLLNKKYTTKDLISSNVCVKGRDGRVHDRFFNRVMFPIFSADQRCIAFGGRVMDDSQPKYLNSSETPIFHKSRVLFGLDKAKSNMTATGTAIVVEGYTDVISMHETGINNVVATLGTALTKQHIRILNQHAKQKIIYLFDGDEAGQRAAERALNFIDEMQLPENFGQKAQLLAITLPENLDPAEYLEKYGKDKMLAELDNAIPLLDYGINRKISAYDLSIGGNRAKAATQAVRVLAPIKDSLIADEYIGKIAQITGLRFEDVRRELDRVPKPKTFDDQNLNAPINSNTQEADKNNIQISPAAHFEEELLCAISNNPQLSISKNDLIRTVLWSYDENRDIFALLQEIIIHNPHITTAGLIQAVNNNSKKWANKLTKLSNMLDIKDDPERHIGFLVYTLKIYEVQNKIGNLRMLSVQSNSDECYDKIVMLQQELSKYKKERDRVS